MGSCPIIDVIYNSIEEETEARIGKDILVIGRLANVVSIVVHKYGRN
jgi:hypothetical protein